MTRLTAVVLALLTVLACAPPPPEQTAEPGVEPTVVYLVRHAERAEDGTDDPPISAEGEARAQLLAQMLRDAGIERIHSTRYRRTESTAAPLARTLGIEVEPYDGSDLEGLAARLLAEGGRHLVVGHSNTTPDAVAALGGTPGEPIEEFEYDRLYIVTLTDGAEVTTLLRFGAQTSGS